MYISSHYDSVYDDMLGYLFETIWPNEVIVVAFYWFFIYNGTIEKGYPETLMGTLFMHGWLFTALTIDWIFNSRLFTLPRTYLYSVLGLTVYLIMNYLAYDFLGYYPYAPFLTWDNLESYGFVAAVYVFQAILVWSMGILTNIIKGGFTVSNPLLDY